MAHIIIIITIIINTVNIFIIFQSFFFIIDHILLVYMELN